MGKSVDLQQITIMGIREAEKQENAKVNAGGAGQVDRGRERNP